MNVLIQLALLPYVWSGLWCLCDLWSPATGLPGAAEAAAGALTRLTRTAAATTTTAALSTIANSLWPLFYYLPQSLTLALRCETRTAALIISAAADGHLTPPLVNNELSSRSAAFLPLPAPLICGCSILLDSASSSLFEAVYF